MALIRETSIWERMNHIEQSQRINLQFLISTQLNSKTVDEISPADKAQAKKSLLLGCDMTGTSPLSIRFQRLRISKCLKIAEHLKWFLMTPFPCPINWISMPIWANVPVGGGNRSTVQSCSSKKPHLRNHPPPAVFRLIDIHNKCIWATVWSTIERRAWFSADHRPGSHLFSKEFGKFTNFQSVQIANCPRQENWYSLLIQSKLPVVCQPKKVGAEQSSRNPVLGLMNCIIMQKIDIEYEYLVGKGLPQNLETLPSWSVLFRWFTPFFFLYQSQAIGFSLIHKDKPPELHNPNVAQKSCRSVWTSKGTKPTDPGPIESKMAFVLIAKSITHTGKSVELWSEKLETIPNKWHFQRVLYGFFLTKVVSFSDPK